MSKPTTFSDYFGVSFGTMMKAGVFDPILNHDTRLFINPMLLPASQHDEFSNFASDLFQQHFSKMFRVMMRSREIGDASWMAASRLLQFPEIRFTCLGYGTTSTRGSSFGKEKTDRVLTIASQVASVGIEDPFILPLYSLLEEDIGPDLISDMTTNVILPAICKFTERTCREFGVELEVTKLKGFEYSLPANPLDDGPVLLLPLDILTELPTATNWSEAMQMASMNAELRTELNSRLGEIFKDTALSEDEKRKARLALIGSADAFKIFSSFMKSKSKKNYDFTKDPAAALMMQKLADVLPSQIPINVHVTELATENKIVKVTAILIDQFKHLVENMGYCRELWVDGKPAREAVAQRLFFAISYAYTAAHNIDLNAEPSMGLGLIDFKFSSGTKRTVVEIKKSNNTKLVQGLRNQLVAYCQAEKARNGFYVVIDYDKPESKRSWVEELRQEAVAVKAEFGISIEVIVIDSREQIAPSKR